MAKTPSSPTSAVTVPALSNDDITAKLRELGALESFQAGEVNRVSVDGTTFWLGDAAYVYNPQKKTPAMTVRLLDLPNELQAFWFNKDGIDAEKVGRPDMAGRYCKSHFAIPEQAREYAEDGTPCRTCPVNPFTKNSIAEGGKRCGWRGDVSFQVLDDDGTVSDETVWVISLPTTGMIEFKGTGKSPEKGHVGEYNFLQLLARLAIDTDTESGSDAAIFKAFTAAKLGLIIAEVRAVPAASQDGGRRYNVVQFTPTRILEAQAQDSLPAGGAKVVDADYDNLPF